MFGIVPCWELHHGRFGPKDDIDYILLLYLGSYLHTGRRDTNRAG